MFASPTCTRSLARVTLDAPISATGMLAEIAEDLVRTVLADHPDEKTISLLAISVSHLEERTGSCSWTFRLGFRTRSAVPAPRRVWRAGWQIALSTRSAALRMGGGRIRVGRVGNSPFRPRRVPRTRRKGPVTLRQPNVLLRDLFRCQAVAGPSPRKARLWPIYIVPHRGRTELFWDAKRTSSVSAPSATTR